MSAKNLLGDMIEDLQKNDLDAFSKKNTEYSKERNYQNLINKLIVMVTDNIIIGNTIVTQNTNNIKGLWYIENYLSLDELSTIKKKLKKDIKSEPITNSSMSGMVAHYGYYYSYDRSGLSVAPAIPDYLRKLIDPTRINDLVGANLITEKFEQLIINEYKPGQQIAYHTDHVKQFGPIIACITVGQAIPIKFKLDQKEKIIDVKEGSMYIMTGDARYQWKHSLKNNTDDNRYSLTYRTLNNM